MSLTSRRTVMARKRYKPKVPRGREDKERLTADIIELAQQYGRYGYRKVAGLLRQAGWIINDKRVERIQTRQALAGRRIVYPVEAAAPQSRLVLRFCRGPHPRWMPI